MTGKPFSAVSLRDALLASHVAGIATCNGAQYDASAWLEPIIEPDRWERLTQMLTDPARRTNPHNANAPRWLLSGHARCGICDDGTTMHASGMGGYGPERGSAYRCDTGSHCATPAIPADPRSTCCPSCAPPEPTRPACGKSCRCPVSGKSSGCCAR